MLGNTSLWEPKPQSFLILIAVVPLMSAGFGSGPKCLWYWIMQQLCIFHWTQQQLSGLPLRIGRRWAPQKSKWGKASQQYLCNCWPPLLLLLLYRKCFLKIAMLLVSPILHSLPDNINKAVTKLCQKVPALTLFTLEGRYNLRRSFESYYGKPWLQWQADEIEKPTLPCLEALLIMFLRVVQLFSSFSSSVRPPAVCI